MTALQRAALKMMNQKGRVKFLNTLRFDILVGGDANKKISDFEMMVATEDQIDKAIDVASTDNHVVHKDSWE